MTERGNWRDYVSVNDYLTVNGLTKKVYWNNGKFLGDCIKDVDGYWKFFFSATVSGGFEGYEFDVLGEMMRELNHAWNEEITRYFETFGDDDDR